MVYLKNKLQSITNELSKYSYSDKILLKIKCFIILIIIFSIIFTVFTKPDEWLWADIPDEIENPKERCKYYKHYYKNMFYYSVKCFSNTGNTDIIPRKRKTKLLCHALLFISLIVIII
jgi:hypothetical protein